MSKPTQQMDEQELHLITQAQHGDRQAFAELVYNHREGVINVAYRMCGDPELAEDIAQDAFIRAWQNLPKYQPKAPFKSWVYRIATNATLDALRSTKQTVDIDKLPLATSAIGPEKTIEEKERAEMVKQAVQELPPASRKVLVLREYEQLSYQQIAQVLDIPVGTVMSRLNYARKAIKQSLKQLMEAPNV